MRVSILSALLIAIIAEAHEGHHHDKSGNSQENKLSASRPEITQVYKQINIQYKENVTLIFESKCAACHSAEAPLPWYSDIPVIHQLIERDRKEAQEHLEISKGFPFAGHGTPEEDLDAIIKTTESGSMPTLFFRLMHPSSALNEREKEIILNWASASKQEISKANPEEKK